MKDKGELNDRVLARDSTRDSGQCSYSKNLEEEICLESISNGHKDCELAYLPRLKDKKHLPEKRKCGKLFTKNGIGMRSIGLQAGGDEVTDIVESSGDEPFCRNFSCNVTENDLEPTGRCSPVVKADNPIDEISFNIDNRFVG